MTPVEAAAPHQQPATAPRRWTGRTRGGVGNWIFLQLLRSCGLWAAYLLLIPVALYFVLSARAAVRAAAEYRRRLGMRVGGPWTGFMQAYLHFFSFGQILLDRIALIGGLRQRFQLRFEGHAHMQQGLAQGRGLVVLSAHCGNWEAAAHSLTELQVPVNIVMYTAEVDHARRYLERFANPLLRVIAADGSADTSLAILAALSRGEIVAMHGDRYLEAEARHTATVSFLGQAARLPTGPYLVAAVSGAPLLHTFVMREGFYRYRYILGPPANLRFGDRSQRQARLRDWAQGYAAELEAVLRRFPYQWHNFYPFWEAPAASKQPSSKRKARGQA